TEARTKYESRLQSLFNKIKALNGKAEIYLIGFYNPLAKYDPNIKELEAIADDWTRASEQETEQYEHVTYIPTDELLANPYDQRYADDNFHANDQGYEQIAQRVLDYLSDEERRSEERRVGKECRSWPSAKHEKKTTYSAKKSVMLPISSSRHGVTTTTIDDI